MVKIINKNIAGGIAGKRTGKVKGIIIHNDYGAMNPVAYEAWLQKRKNNGQLGLGFAHYYIDKDTILRVEDTFNKAWHSANNDGNANYIGLEVVESFYGVITDEEFIENENMTLRQGAEDLKYYGLPVNRDTVRLHNEFSATSCPHRSWDIHVGKGKAYNTSNKNKLKDYFIAKIKAYQKLGSNVNEMLKNEGIQGEVTVPVPAATGEHKVINGDTLWGIAIKYNTSISNIKALNKLTSDNINIGQVLKVNGNASKPAPTPVQKPVVKPSTPTYTTESQNVGGVQTFLNRWFNAGLKVDNANGGATKAAIVRAIQTELNKQFKAGLTVDGDWGNATEAKWVTVREKASGNLTRLIQAMLICKGYGVNGFDGKFGDGLEKAVKKFQGTCGIDIDGVVGKGTARKLFN